MRNFIPLLCSLPILLASCSSVLSDFDKLNPGEYASLVKRCAMAVDKLPAAGKHPVSRKDKMLVKIREPKFAAKYTGYKTGYFKTSWKLGPSYIIMVEGRGKMTDEKCPIWVTIQRFEE
ncbi:MAG: hypothetical protein GXP32_05680 [Kiritimatiellaeota bacterium]|nr:hypothetical protein [Kiritimatiellota bacterium]